MTKEPLTSAESTSRSDLIGCRKGDYQFLRRLGSGAMAEVYLAEQISLKRQVAMKILKPELANDQNYVRRFALEAQAVAALVHANIVQIYEVGQIDGLNYIAQEYVQGLNLREYLTRFGPPETKTALRIIRQVVAALHKAAQQNIVHRDIKPENIMISPSGEVKVADFGLARVVEAGEKVQLTQIGMTMGTPLYMSPEQVEGKSIDIRSDIYSLGVTCYHLLSGNPPFQGDTALAIALQHVKNSPRRLENSRADLPGGLCRIVHKMLEKKPADRYQTPGELLIALRELQPVGVQDDWDQTHEIWSDTELGALATARWDATAGLDNLMKTQAIAISRRSSWLPIILLVLLFFVLGGSAAWLTSEPPLLDNNKSQALSIPRMEKVSQQYEYAHFEPDSKRRDEAYRAVIDYFPSPAVADRYWINLATQQLAKSLLIQNQYAEALELFTQLSESGVENHFRAIGLAGQCIVYSRKQKIEAHKDKIQELIRLRDYLKSDVEMETAIADIIRKNYNLLSKQDKKELDQWLKSTSEEINQ